MIRYVVIALGDLAPDGMQATDEDLEFVQQAIETKLPGFKATILSERASRLLTTALVQEVVA